MSPRARRHPPLSTEARPERSWRRSMSLNKAMIIGNLGRDPEMRYTPNGQAVTQFTVAVNRNYKDASGEWKEETDRKSTRLNSSHANISYAVFCLKKKKQ